MSSAAGVVVVGSGVVLLSEGAGLHGVPIYPDTPQTSREVVAHRAVEWGTCSKSFIIFDKYPIFQTTFYRDILRKIIKFSF